MLKCVYVCVYVGGCSQEGLQISDMGNWVDGGGIHCDRAHKKTNLERRNDNISSGRDKLKDPTT